MSISVIERSKSPPELAQTGALGRRGLWSNITRRRCHHWPILTTTAVKTSVASSFQYDDEDDENTMEPHRPHLPSYNQQPGLERKSSVASSSRYGEEDDQYQQHNDTRLSSRTSTARHQCLKTTPDAQRRCNQGSSATPSFQLDDKDDDEVHL